MYSLGKKRHTTPGQHRISALRTCVLAIALCYSALTHASEPVTTHALSMYGEHKYPDNFQHFDYANPDAPKGGTLHQAVVLSSGFDSLNPFVVKGVPAFGMQDIPSRGLSDLFYMPLAIKSGDEPFSLYGLVAESMVIPEDRSWIIFNIDPRARFHDGHPIDANDVKFTFETLIEHGMPIFSYYYADVELVEILSPSEVKFHFKGGENRELPLIVAELPVLPEHFWANKDFESSGMLMPLGSGPYTIEDIDTGRSITYSRVKDWWAIDHPTMKGRFNFDRVRFDYCRDTEVAVEALKAGEFDYRLENSAKSWSTNYAGDQFDEGLMSKTLIPDGMPDGMQGYALNTRREVLKDPLVREALAYAFDFEWTNRQLFYGLYKRSHSYFSGSDMASSGLPSAAELKHLEPLRDQLPPRVFTDIYQPPSSTGPGGFRANLRTALQLLKQAGWQPKDGKLLNTSGEQMALEIMYRDPSWERINQPFARNLRRMGIDARLRMVDTTQYIARMNNYDYDITTTVIPQSNSPGNEQREYWGSNTVDNVGGRNSMGVRDPAVDTLIKLLIAAPDREELVARTRALDRVLLWGHYVIPQWHYPFHRLVWWNIFERPDVLPVFSVGVSEWWSKEP